MAPGLGGFEVAVDLAPGRGFFLNLLCGLLLVFIVPWMLACWPVAEHCLPLSMRGHDFVLRAVPLGGCRALGRCDLLVELGLSCAGGRG